MIITFLIAKIILGGYWLMLAPVLFLPLGTVLLSPQVLRGIFGYVVIPLAVVFAALGAIFLFTLTLPDAVTVLAGVQAIWLLAAAITLVARSGKQRGGQSLPRAMARHTSPLLTAPSVSNARTEPHL